MIRSFVPSSAAAKLLLRSSGTAFSLTSSPNCPLHATVSRRGSLSTRSQVCRAGKCGPSARTVEPAPQARSTTLMASSDLNETATASSTIGLRARKSWLSRKASHSAEKPLMRAFPAWRRRSRRIAARWAASVPPADAASDRRRRRSASAITRRRASASALTSPGGTSKPACCGTVSGMAPAVVPITGQTARQCLGVGHSISLETGGENEQIGLVIERGETFGRYGAKRCDPAGKAGVGICWPEVLLPHSDRA